jgi:SAM-dependent methyltransferase
MPPGVPPYFDFLIDAFRRGETGRFVHLGHWNVQAGFDPDAPPVPNEFALAQARLNAYLLEMAALRDGQSVLDAGCGFGGTLEAVNGHHSGMRLTGVNIDPRQLGLCRQIAARNGNRLDWEHADACELPHADASFDRVLCIEAMFHFSSRRRFFAQAARVLKPGGRLVASDLVLTARGRDWLAVNPALGRDLVAVYGPWPDLAGRDADHRQLAAAAGLAMSEQLDATRNTVRSHRFTVPSAYDTEPPANPALRAAWVLRRLHRDGGLLYLYFRCDKA